MMRLSGSVREYSCPSEGEENAALYNMACCWAALGQKQVGRGPSLFAAERRAAGAAA